MNKNIYTLPKNIYLVKHFKAIIDGKEKVFYHITDTVREGSDLKQCVNKDTFGAIPSECEFFFSIDNAMKRYKELALKAMNEDRMFGDDNNDYYLYFEWVYDEELGANIIKGQIIMD